jgi:hypothetical protein
MERDEGQKKRLDDKARRKELLAEYKESRPGAGVYRILNTKTHRNLLGATPDLRAMQNRFDFAKSMKSASGLDGRLAADIREYGIDAFSFEVLETLDVEPTASRTEVRKDLATLVTLWREKLGPDSLY